MAKLLKTKPKALLIDVTGVLYESGLNKLIDGSLEAIRLLNSIQIKYKLVTNETQATREGLVSKLRRIGYEFTADDILSPGPVCRDFIIKHGLRPHLLIHPELNAEFDGLNAVNPNCVVIGDAANHFTYEAMNNAFNALIAMQKPLILSMGKGKYYQEHGQLVLDLGAFTAALEYATDAETVVIGKPSKEYYNAALEALNVKAEEAVMIGDDINSDVGGAQQCGIPGVLVRTGKFRPERDLNHPTIKPNAIVDNLLQFVQWMIKSN